MVDENSTFGGFLTDIGEAKQSNANALRIPWKLTHMLLGDANGSDPVPDPEQTGLIHQVYRAAINQLSIDPANPAILIAELVLPPNVGGWWIRELGLEDEDGDFVAVANCAPSYKPLLAQGSGRNQVVRMHLILSNTANVELKVDPSVVLATREYVDDEIDAHAQSRNHPDATTTAKGFMQYGTSEETRQGTRTDRAAHLAGVHAAFNQYGIGKASSVYPSTAVIGDLPLGAFVSINANEGENVGLPATGEPAGTPVFFNILTIGTSTRRTQIAVQVFTGSAKQSATYTRQRHDDTWSPWRLFYHSGNFDPDSKADATAYQNIAVFNAVGTTNWNVPQELKDGRRKVQVIVTAAGGQGGISSVNEARGGGGGAGGTAIGLVDLSGVSSVSITIGNSEGARSSSFGPYLSATGGGNGADYTGGASAGGPGGTGTGGDINLPGGWGSDAPELNSGAVEGGSGDGGSSYWGGGRRSGSGSGGVNNLPPGAGGGGSETLPRSRGGNGKIIVRW